MTSARPDTRYLAASPITTDTSQRLTNLTISGAGGYEDPSVRMQIEGSGRGRSLELSVEISTALAGVLLDLGTDVGDPPYQIRVAAGGNVEFVHEGGAIATITPPNIDGTAKTYIVAWNTEPNPATTGAANALRSEFMAYDVDGAALTFSILAHDTITADSGCAFAVGGTWDGSTFASAYTGTINGVRVSARFHTRVEVREHWVAQTAAPSVDGITAVEGPVLPTAMTEAGAIAGPQYQFAAAAMAVGRNRHRLLGPVVQCLLPTWPVWLAALSGTAPATWVHTLSDGYQTIPAWLWRRKIPRQSEQLLGLLQWATWYTAGSLVSVKIRLYCADAPPHLAAEWSAVTLSRTTHDGVNGLGVLDDFDGLRVRRGPDGYSWLWIGALVDVAPGNTNAFAVREIAFAPYSKPAADGQAPNQWGP